MQHKVNTSRNAVVSTVYEFAPITSETPRNSWCLLLTTHNKCVEGMLQPGENPGYKGWFPYPGVPKEMK